MKKSLGESPIFMVPSEQNQTPLRTYISRLVVVVVSQGLVIKTDCQSLVVLGDSINHLSVRQSRCIYDCLLALVVGQALALVSQ